MLPQEKNIRIKKPPWLRRPLCVEPTYEKIRDLLRKGRLHTVCQEAKCPNLWECFSKGTATFLIMGSRCTRACRFCAVTHGPLTLPDPEEATRIADAVQTIGLKYVVITSVTRDDLPDGGARFFAEAIKKIRKRIPEVRIEVLIPDFQGNADALQIVVEARPDILDHNLETVPRLYPSVRPQAGYQRSLELLGRVKCHDSSIITKSGLMLGLGEKCEEIQETLVELLDAGCNILTLGQYLQPTKEHLPVDRFISPEEFDSWRRTALAMGFSAVASGPFVRSSYSANELYFAMGNIN
jgi:lipoyl synthase